MASLAMKRLLADYPWIRGPLVAGAPMRLISLAPLAVEVSRGGGIGFIGAGSDTSQLDDYLADAQKLLSSSPLSTNENTMPVGVGFLVWGASMTSAIASISKYRPAAVWLFAPRKLADLEEWTSRTREVTDNASKIWIQVGTVSEAIEVTKACKPDVLVVQGQDAGGHGLEKSGSLISLLPEVVDAVEEQIEEKDRPVIIAAGGIADSRGAAAALVLGASGVVLGTRLLASSEANIAAGYQAEVLRADDGGINTVRGSVYDILRGTTDWPSGYGARGVTNQSFHDAIAGMSWEENKKLYQEAVESGDKGWGPQGRMTTYASSAVGLVKEVKPAAEITREIIDGTIGIMKKAGSRF